jgi:hypothetical protein
VEFGEAVMRYWFFGRNDLDVILIRLFSLYRANILDVACLNKNVLNDLISLSLKVSYKLKSIYIFSKF